MLKINWSYPNEIRFGIGRIKELGDICIKLGVNKPLIVTDQTLIDIGLTEDFRKSNKLIFSMEKNIDDPNFFSNADSKFHMLLSESTGTELLIWMVSEINNVRNQKQWSRMRKITLNPKTIENYTEQHKKILNAIKARAPETAALLMKEHLENVRSSLTASTLF